MENLIFLLVMLALGFGFGRLAEKRHYRSIHQREDSLRHLLVLPDKTPPAQFLNHDSVLVSGSVVISVDYFKTFVASLRNLVGGRVSSYESLLDRARREAILRMQEEADAYGADAVFNLKFETSRIGQNGQQGLGSVEVLAYGTAFIPASAAVTATSAPQL